jgi:endonuclease/exonuclease/phosphatase family metal-dependent hydrolase
LQFIRPQLSAAPKFQRVSQRVSESRPFSTHKNVLHVPVLFGRDVKIMSYNAHNLGLDTSPRDNSAKSLYARAQAILLEDPDVVAWQEVASKQALEQLNQKYLKGQYPNVVVLNTNDPRGIHVGFMSKKALKVVDTRTHTHLQNKAGEPVFKRDFLGVTFETEAGYRFTVYNSHFKSMRGGEAQTMPVRLLEAQTGADIIKQQMLADPKANIMVVGDLNTKPGPLGWPVLDALSRRNESDPTYKLTEVLRPNDGSHWQPTWKGGKRENKLDYMYVNDAFKTAVKKAYVGGSFWKWPWKEASDHVPVVSIVDTPDAVAKPVGAAGPAFAGKRQLPYPSVGTRLAVNA